MAASWSASRRMTRPRDWPGRRLLCAALVAAMFAPPLVAAETIGRVAETSGTVVRIKAAGAPELLGGGSPLATGDVIETQTNSGAELRYGDGTVVRLAAGSRFTVPEYRLAPQQAGEERFVSRLLAGAMRVVTGTIAKRQPRNARFVAHTATIGIRGTDFTVRMCETECELADSATVARAGQAEFAGRVGGSARNVFAVDGAGRVRPLAVSAPVNAGDIVAASDGVAVLVMRDQTTISLDPGTALAIREFRYDEESPANARVELALLVGRVQVATGHLAKTHPERFRFFVGDLPVRVHGTIFGAAKAAASNAAGAAGDAAQNAGNTAQNAGNTAQNTADQTADAARNAANEGGEAARNAAGQAGQAGQAAHDGAQDSADAAQRSADTVGGAIVGGLTGAQSGSNRGRRSGGAGQRGGDRLVGSVAGGIAGAVEGAKAGAEAGAEKGEAGEGAGAAATAGTRAGRAAGREAGRDAGREAREDVASAKQDADRVGGAIVGGLTGAQSGSSGGRRAGGAGQRGGDRLVGSVAGGIAGAVEGAKAGAEAGAEKGEAGEGAGAAATAGKRAGRAAGREAGRDAGREAREDVASAKQDANTVGGAVVGGLTGAQSGSSGGRRAGGAGQRGGDRLVGSVAGGIAGAVEGAKAGAEAGAEKGEAGEGAGAAATAGKTAGRAAGREAGRDAGREAREDVASAKQDANTVGGAVVGGLTGAQSGSSGGRRAGGAGQRGGDRLVGSVAGGIAGAVEGAKAGAEAGAEKGEAGEGAGAAATAGTRAGRAAGREAGRDAGREAREDVASAKQDADQVGGAVVGGLTGAQSGSNRGRRSGGAGQRGGDRLVGSVAGGIAGAVEGAKAGAEAGAEKGEAGEGAGAAAKAGTRAGRAAGREAGRDAGREAREDVASAKQDADANASAGSKSGGDAGKDAVDGAASAAVSVREGAVTIGSGSTGIRLGAGEMAEDQSGRIAKGSGGIKFVAPNPGLVAVADTGGFFGQPAATAGKPAAPGVYVSVNDGAVALAQGGKEVLISRGEAAMAPVGGGPPVKVRNGVRVTGGAGLRANGASAVPGAPVCEAGPPAKGGASPVATAAGIDLARLRPNSAIDGKLDASSIDPTNTRGVGKGGADDSGGGEDLGGNRFGPDFGGNTTIEDAAKDTGRSIGRGGLDGLQSNRVVTGRHGDTFAGNKLNQGVDARNFSGGGKGDQVSAGEEGERTFISRIVDGYNHQVVQGGEKAGLAGAFGGLWAGIVKEFGSDSRFQRQPGVNTAQGPRGRPRGDDNPSGGGSGVPLYVRGGQFGNEVRGVERAISAGIGAAGGAGDGRTDQQATGSGGGMMMQRDEQLGVVKDTSAGRINWDAALQINEVVNPGRQ